MSRQPGPAAGLVIVMVLGFVAGGFAYVVQRITCALGPGIPLADAGCDTDDVRVALFIGTTAAVIGVVGQVLAWRHRDGGGDRRPPNGSGE